MVTQDRSVYPFTKQGEETLNKIRKLGTYILRVSISGLFSKVQHIFLIILIPIPIFVVSDSLAPFMTFVYFFQSTLCCLLRYVWLAPPVT